MDGFWTVQDGFPCTKPSVQQSALFSADSRGVTGHGQSCQMLTFCAKYTKTFLIHVEYDPCARAEQRKTKKSLFLSFFAVFCLGFWLALARRSYSTRMTNLLMNSAQNVSIWQLCPCSITPHESAENTVVSWMKPSPYIFPFFPPFGFHFSQ